MNILVISFIMLLRCPRSSLIHRSRRAEFHILTHILRALRPMIRSVSDGWEFRSVAMSRAKQRKKKLYAEQEKYPPNPFGKELFFAVVK